jgi:hypothetical protein
MKKLELKQIIKEEITKISLEGIIDSLFDSSYKIQSQPYGYLISKHTRDEDSSFNININNHMVDELGPYYLNMISKIVVSSQSLADPKAAYRTTSARRVKRKTIKTVDYIKHKDILIKKIQSHLDKVNKIK